MGQGRPPITTRRYVRLCIDLGAPTDLNDAQVPIQSAEASGGVGHHTEKMAVATVPWGRREPCMHGVHNWATVRRRPGWDARLPSRGRLAPRV